MKILFVYLTSVDKEQRKSILHVEDIKKLEIVSITEQLSRVKSETGYGEAEEHKEHLHRKHKRK